MRFAADWSVFRGTCETPGAEGKPTFGLCATLSDGTRRRFSDVALSEETARAIATRLKEAEIEECHLADVVEDEILRQYLG